MPGKKPSKSDRSPIARAPSTPSPSRRPDSDNSSIDEDLNLRHLLSQASARFPSFIDESAFVGRISDRDSNFRKDNQARVFLSDSAMRSLNLVDKSLVSVSLPAAVETCSSKFPLDSLAEGCARHFAIDVGDHVPNDVGNYFALATVMRSSEDLKDGIKLSWGLSCTMGFPAIGRSVFVCRVSLNYLDNKINLAHAYLHKCKDLYLTLVPPKAIPVNSSNVNGTSVESVRGDSECRIAASPKTPLFTSKPSSPGTTPAHQRKSHDFISSTDSSVCSDMASVRLALADEQGNELLHICAARWLYGRHLLSGNIVTVPLIFGQICAFIVESADKLLNGCDNHDVMHDEKHTLLSHQSQVHNSPGEADVTFFVDNKTNVHLSDPISVCVQPSEVSLQGEDLTCKANRDIDTYSIPRLGGLSTELAKLKEIIMNSMTYNGHMRRYKGVLLHGPPGTGKTSLAAACARDAGANLFTINGSEIVSQYYGESEQALYDVFDSARRAAPAVVFIDELDTIAPTRKDGGEELSLRMVATLSKLMDDIKRDDGILVIAATNRADSIDPAMRRPGRLDREIEIGVPSPEQRLDILHTLLNGMDHSLGDTEIRALASETHAFVGADLAALCSKAAMAALRRYIKLTNSGRHSLTPRPDVFDSCREGFKTQRNADGVSAGVVGFLSSALSELTMSPEPISSNGSQHVQENGDIYHNELNRTNGARESALLKVTAEDFKKAKMEVRPCAMREVMLELPKVRWEDVGGQDKIKKQLIQAVQWPQMHPEAFGRIGIRPPRGLLMIGPPGCSKTLMARAVASEAKLNFFAVKGPELFNKWVGESEKAVRSLFAKARANSPAIIFFDEIDGLAISRGQENDGTSVANRVVTQLLQEMEGLDQRLGVTVIAATNRPDKIDDALRRPGRFDRLLEVQPPDATDREDIFRIHTREMPCHHDVSMKELAQLTENYTGADIKLICREAALAALEESMEISEVSMEHFKIGIGRVPPSDVHFFTELAKQYCSEVDK